MPFRDRIEQMKDNAKYKKIQQHVQENRVPYSIAAGAGIGVVSMLLLKGSPIGITNSSAPVFNNTPVISPTIAPVFNNTLNNVGHVTKIVQGLDDDGKLWPKIGALATELAKEHGIEYNTARTMLSKHLNGHSHDVFGKQYITYGLGTTG